MKIQCQSSLDQDFGTLILPFWEGGIFASKISREIKSLSFVLKSGDFTGKSCETLLVYEGSQKVILLGFGKQEGFTSELLRRSYAAALKLAQAKKTHTLHIALPSVAHLSRKEMLTALLDGVMLTNYAFDRLKGKTAKENPLFLVEKAVLVEAEVHDELIVQKCLMITSGVFLARDLVNGNADDVNPQMLAETAKSLEKRAGGLKVTILEKEQIEKEKMGLFLAVNRGSSLEPRLIQLAYHGKPDSKEHIVLIGKGITYDTGGLSLKPTDNMLTMKCDMAGAAAMLASVVTAAELGLKVNVTALIPATENAIDAKSYKVGDVYTSMNGTTVEITNTDAEGRLVLADAMSYALSCLKPTTMIDLATLTGGIVVALGEEISGLFTDSEELSRELVTSSAETGEQLWRMPLYADYKELLKSDIADLMNSAGRGASSVTAALFLKEFSSSLIPWAHIDCAGSAFLSKPKYYHPTKATGYGVRLLVNFLEKRSKE